ncbi:MAG: hypothetical protein HDS24_05125 [Bacteroides sp.]|nr:hypothetical protein [Bacteroides sp.]
MPGIHFSGSRRLRRRAAEPRSKLYAYNWLEGISGTDDYDVVEVMFKNTRNGYFVNTSRLPLKIGDIVAVESTPGHDIGRVNMIGHLVKLQMRKAGVKETTQLKRVFRLATESDLEKFDEARAKEHETMIRTRRIAEELGLDMKIGDVEYQGDGGKAIFYYIADERVDFRKLIRILADTFKIRVEMKQIGARQEAGRIGGIGPCGRPLCCASWMTHFVSVGTGAARIQDISMNPQKLAGQCGKLKCCLNFEIDAYTEAQRQLPDKNQTLETQDATYYLFKSDPLAKLVTYSTDKKIPANLVTIDARRAFEVIALNKQGVKVATLQTDEAVEAERQSQPVDLVEQESLTRFDKSKKKKKKGKEQKTRDQKTKETRDQKPKEARDQKPHKEQRKDGREPTDRKEQPRRDQKSRRINPGQSDRQPQQNQHGEGMAGGNEGSRPKKRKPKPKDKEKQSTPEG